MPDPPLAHFSPEMTGSDLRTAGVLGGIGSGKSTAAGLIAEVLSCSHFDADQEVGRLLATTRVAAQLETALGTSLTGSDGRLDRAKLAAQIFADTHARKAIEAILHPAVRLSLYRYLQRAEASEVAWAVLDVPLLLENNLSPLCDILIFVEVPDEIRCQRACQRHAWSENEWARRESTQHPIDKKKSVAHAILDNAGGVELLRTQVESLLPTLLALPPRSLRDRWPSLNELPPGAPDS